jgi:hypothetical protein
MKQTERPNLTTKLGALTSFLPRAARGRMKEGELRNLRAFVSFPLFVVRYSFWLKIL